MKSSSSTGLTEGQETMLFLSFHAKLSNKAVLKTSWESDWSGTISGAEAVIVGSRDTSGLAARTWSKEDDDTDGFHEVDLL